MADFQNVNECMGGAPNYVQALNEGPPPENPWASDVERYIASDIEFHFHLTFSGDNRRPSRNLCPRFERPWLSVFDVDSFNAAQRLEGVSWFSGNRNFRWLALAS